MTPDQWYLALSIAVTAVCIFAVGWQCSNVWHERKADRGLTDERAPLPTRAGWLESSGWAPDDTRGFISANDGTQIGWEPHTVPLGMVSTESAWALADAGYQLGQERAAADQVHREAEAIWAEVEGDPTRWQR